MTAQDLISNELAPLNPSQTGREALAILHEFQVRHLPVVAENRLLGLISEEDIFHHEIHQPLGEYELSPRRLAVPGYCHAFDVMRIMGENRLTVIPVETVEGLYLGLISQTDLMRFLTETTTFSAPGGILVLEMKKHDYSLAQISRLAESENVSILGSFISSNLESDLLELTLKLNRPDLARLISSFERHGISVRETFAQTDFQDSLKERYDALMKWLEV